MQNSILCVSACSLCLLVLAIAQPFAQTVAPASGKAMCSALTPADFNRAGVAISRLRDANLDDNRSAYCMYDGEAGKSELDIFYPAGDTVAEGQNAQRAAQSAIGGRFEPVRVAGADEAVTNAASPKRTDSASIVVRKGTTVFNISVPPGPKAQQQLVALSEIVLRRLKQ
jgi:hypothetical protein